MYCSSDIYCLSVAGPLALTRSQCLSRYGHHSIGITYKYKLYVHFKKNRASKAQDTAPVVTASVYINVQISFSQFSASVTISAPNKRLS